MPKQDLTLQIMNFTGKNKIIDWINEGLTRQKNNEKVCSIQMKNVQLFKI